MIKKQFPYVSSREWLAALLVAGVTAVLITIPYWLGYATTPDGRVYMHLIMNPEDSLTYWAKMQQGFTGAWVYTIPFTPEPHQGAAVGVFYVWLGQLARLLNLPLTAVWHGSRILSAFMLYLVTFAFTAVFLANKLTRWAAFLLAIFGSGLGWLLFLTGQTFWLGTFPVDFKQPGAHIFFTTLTFPHIIVGTTLILWNMVVLKVMGDWRLEIRDSFSIFNLQSPTTHWRLVISAGVGNVLLGIAYPFLIYIVALTAVLTYLYLLYKVRRVLWWQGFQIAIMFLIPAPLYLYYAYVWQTNDIFRTWNAQAGTPSPPWPHYLVSFGVLLLLALLFWWKRPSQRASFAVLWGWVTAVMLLVYAPLGPQRRFVQGVHVALAVLAAAGLVEVALPWLQRTSIWQRIVTSPRYSTEKLSRFLVILFLLFMSLSNLLLWADVSRIAGLTQPDLFFRDGGEFAALNWLRENNQPGVILGDYQTGNFAATFSAYPVILGHWAETNAYEDKLTAVAQFFDSQTPDSWRQALLTHYAVRYVWFGPREQQLGDFDPTTAVYLHPVYQNETITIFILQEP